MAAAQKAEQKAPRSSGTMLRWTPRQRNSWERYLEAAHPGTTVSRHGPVLLLAPPPFVSTRGEIRLQLLREHSHAGVGMGWTCFPHRCPTAERDQASTARAMPGLARLCSAKRGRILPSARESPSPARSTCPGAASHTRTRMKGCAGNLGGVWQTKSPTHHRSS